jgi:thiopeptide-type bacteriocin biosynthesis protein
LLALIEAPRIRDALYVASPGLFDGLDGWRRDPGSEAGRAVERAVIRYVSRMAGRATPFGLCATMSLGGFGDRTSARLAEGDAVRAHGRLGLAYITGLVDAVRARLEVRDALCYVPNSTLYPAGGWLRYLESRPGGRQSHDLVSVEVQPYLLAVLARAANGATAGELAAALVDDDPEIGRDDALAYVGELVLAQVLVPTWAPCVSGAEPVAHLVEVARDVPELAGVRRMLVEASERLQAADAAEPGSAAERYRAIARQLGVLPGTPLSAASSMPSVPPASLTPSASPMPSGSPASTPTPSLDGIDEGRLLCVDAFRDGFDVRLPPGVADEIRRGVDALRRLTPVATDTPGERFKARFVERYDRRAVPLLEALDEESGVGLGFARRPGQTTGPLLAGFEFPAGRGGEAPFEPIHRVLLGKLEQIWRSRARELVLTDDDIASARIAAPAPLPDAFGVLATLVAGSAAEVDAGEFRVVLKNVHGPNGAVALGRYCHGDVRLADAVRAYLRAEEALAPGALFAEVVHQPPGHQGNVSCRPRLRRHEIPVLGASSAPRADLIPLDDLWISVEAGRVVLRSQQRGREVRPRLGNVDNYMGSSVGVYRFLCMLQNEPANGLRFRWGPLRAATASLPRVVYGRTVLATALWNIAPPIVAAWRVATGAARFAAVQRFRVDAGLPRWVGVRDDDKHIPLDLDNALAVDALVRLMQGRSPALEEVYPGPDELVVRGAEGRHVHELVVPFIRESASAQRTIATRAAPGSAAAESASSAGRGAAPGSRERASPSTASGSEAMASGSEMTGADAVPRRFPPGSSWLYLKLYGGPMTLDRGLAGGLGEAIEHVVQGGAVTRWFFVRYRDPEPHLRLRFQGEPRRLDTEVWPVLREASARALAADAAWRLVIDTYEREVERYGGPAGIELAEDMFRADSDAALAIARGYPGGAGADARWRLALCGIDRLLADLGFEPAARREVVERSRGGFAAELGGDDRGFRDQLDQRYRRERLALEALLAQTAADGGSLAPGLAALDARSAGVRRAAERWQARARDGQLGASIAALAGSLIHMHVNRMLVDDARAQELILYDFLARCYRSRQARLGGGRGARS